MEKGDEDNLLLIQEVLEVESIKNEEEPKEQGLSRHNQAREENQIDSQGHSSSSQKDSTPFEKQQIFMEDNKAPKEGIEVD